eukprot:TRINITY_DN2673_c0_g1_i1.p1 TRINITY_DN2673_c0_g1~~TRINITY_DN2673_c0_g1_i1.p1  ORF type:complete len:552 (+),score=137.57 TRINITY_DN2673_c0_g1_i1:43-1698(+)
MFKWFSAQRVTPADDLTAIKQKSASPPRKIMDDDQSENQIPDILDILSNFISNPNPNPDLDPGISFSPTSSQLLPDLLNSLILTPAESAELSHLNSSITSDLQSSIVLTNSITILGESGRDAPSMDPKADLIDLLSSFHPSIHPSLVKPARTNDNLLESSMFLQDSDLLRSTHDLFHSIKIPNQSLNQDKVIASSSYTNQQRDESKNKEPKPAIQIKSDQEPSSMKPNLSNPPPVPSVPSSLAPTLAAWWKFTPPTKILSRLDTLIDDMINYDPISENGAWFLERVQLRLVGMGKMDLVDGIQGNLTRIVRGFEAEFQAAAQQIVQFQQPIHTLPKGGQPRRDSSTGSNPIRDIATTAGPIDRDSFVDLSWSVLDILFDRHLDRAKTEPLESFEDLSQLLINLKATTMTNIRRYRIESDIIRMYGALGLVYPKEWISRTIGARMPMDLARGQIDSDTIGSYFSRKAQSGSTPLPKTPEELQKEIDVVKSLCGLRWFIYRLYIEAGKKSEEIGCDVLVSMSLAFANLERLRQCIDTVAAKNNQDQENGCILM